MAKSKSKKTNTAEGEQKAEVRPDTDAAAAAPTAAHTTPSPTESTKPFKSLKKKNREEEAASFKFEIVEVPVEPLEPFWYIEKPVDRGDLYEDSDVTFASCKAITRRAVVKRDTFADNVRTHLIHLGIFLNNWGYGVKSNGPAFIMYEEWPEDCGEPGYKDDIPVTFGLPVDGDLEYMHLFEMGSEEIASFTAQTCTVKGHYRRLREAHRLARKGAKKGGRIVEVLKKGPYETMEEEDYETVVYYET